RYPGVKFECKDGSGRIVIPPAYRTDHESHFAEVAGEVVKRIVERQPLTPIEASHMLAKYFVTTFGVALARSLTA
ncbi:MAG TPA: putative oxidoreductase C-terminal domain-containing protein, partial [Gemmataceae bacterium]|nr:putative oxidoreductase C-terminal domain-containing protein [Gemmataceae bacterium]